MKKANDRHEKWCISCQIGEYEMLQSSATAATTNDELVSPEGTQKGKNTCHLAGRLLSMGSQRVQHD